MWLTFPAHCKASYKRGVSYSRTGSCLLLEQTDLLHCKILQLFESTMVTRKATPEEEAFNRRLAIMVSEGKGSAMLECPSRLDFHRLCCALNAHHQHVTYLRLHCLQPDESLVLLAHALYSNPGCLEKLRIDGNQLCDYEPLALILKGHQHEA